MEVSLDKDDDDDSAPIGTTMMTEYGEVDGAQAAELLRNASTHHLATRSFTGEETKTTVNPADKFNDAEFRGLLIDTGAARVSTAGLPQLRALTRLLPDLRLDKSKAGAVRVLFGWDAASSIGTVTVKTPVGAIVFHVIDKATPFIFSLADMDKKRIELLNLRNVLLQGSKVFPVNRMFGHAWLQLDTKPELLLLQSNRLHEPRSGPKWKYQSDQGGWSKSETETRCH